tara:strand:- start:861 stop:1361 length:501 start_codon:yes stop_codon:yes gene_type:complete
MQLFDFQKYGNGMPTGQVFINNPEQDEAEGVNLDQYIGDRKVVLIGIPGAFTPTCMEKHLPGYVKNEREFLKQGIDEIICMSVNDPHVMYAFDDYVNSEGSKITMAADPFGEVSEQLGLLTDMGTLGKRCKRFSSHIADGRMQKIFVDEKELDNSTAEKMLEYLKQ